MAGDIAAFVNLGFSDDSRYFMFGQFGITENNSFPYADLYIVDVRSNIFTPYGKKNFFAREAVEPGNSGMGALLNLVEQNIALKVKYNINHLATGRILYLLLNGDTPKETISFRDFNTGNTYNVRLFQNATGTGKNISSSFHISATVTKSSGASASLNTGHPSFARTGVVKYKIKQIILAPDERSLVFVIEKEEIDTKGINIRYMVETAVIAY